MILQFLKNMNDIFNYETKKTRPFNKSKELYIPLVSAPSSCVCMCVN